MKLTLAAVVVALAVTAGASASPFVKFGVQDDAYLSSRPVARAGLQTLDQLGVGLVRYLVNWRQIAPTKPRHPANPGDPAYDWTAVDATLGALHAHRITGARDAGAHAGVGQRRPRPERGADEQVRAGRFRGRRRQALPVAAAVGDLERAEPAVVPEAGLAAALRAAAAQPGATSSCTRSTLRTASPAAATSPRSTSSGLSPVTFMRGMHVAHARLDAYSHHPYPVTPRRDAVRFARGVCRYCTGVLSWPTSTS